MATYRIPRSQVKATLDVINSSPWRVFTATVVRRTDLFLRYAPINMTKNGPFVREGDHMPLDSDDRGNPNIIYDCAGCRYDLTDASTNRRRGCKILLQAAGERREISVKNYDREKGNQNRHAPPITGAGRNYDPLRHDLYPLAGFYNDALKTQPNGQRMMARFGQWRAYTMVCMRGITEFRSLGHKWIITDEPQDGPIQYPTEDQRLHARKHIVTEAGTATRGHNLIGDTEAWEAEMGLTV